MQNGRDRKILLFVKHYEKRKEAVYNFALKMLNDSEKAADVTQNVFLKLFENIELIRNENKIPVWIFITARNEIFAYYRSGERKERNYDADELENFNLADDDNPGEKFELKELREIILTELDKLSDMNRETFLLREYGGLSYKEISEVTGAEINLVKSRLFKTRKKLIEKISKII
jgi:RNA polymerase sigma-70 factor (ECF subfamily)